MLIVGYYNRLSHICINMKQTDKTPVTDRQSIPVRVSTKQNIVMKIKNASQKLIAVRLKQVRTEMKLTQAGLAELLGKDKQFIQRLESGKSDPLLSTLYDMAQAIQKPLTYITNIGEN